VAARCCQHAAASAAQNILRCRACWCTAGLLPMLLPVLPNTSFAVELAVALLGCCRCCCQECYCQRCPPTFFAAELAGALLGCCRCCWQQCCCQWCPRHPSQPSLLEHSWAAHRLLPVLSNTPFAVEHAGAMMGCCRCCCCCQWCSIHPSLSGLLEQCWPAADAASNAAASGAQYILRCRACWINAGLLPVLLPVLPNTAFAVELAGAQLRCCRSCCQQCCC